MNSDRVNVFWSVNGEEVKSDDRESGLISVTDKMKLNETAVQRTLTIAATNTHKNVTIDCVGITNDHHVIPANGSTFMVQGKTQNIVVN